MIRIRGIDGSFIRFYKKLFIYDVMAGIITLLCTFLLPLYSDKMSVKELVGFGILFFIASISFIIVLADLLLKKGIINEIGKGLELTFNEDSIIVENDDEFSKSFLWEHINVIEIYDRKMFLKRKGQFKVISVIPDQQKYIEMMDQYSEREIRSKKKHEMLQYHFTFMFNSDAIDMINKHWHGTLG